MQLFKALRDLVVKLVLYPVFSKYVYMPGATYTGRFEKLDDVESEILERSRKIVNVLAVEIGERSIKTPEALERSANYIEGAFEELGYEVTRHPFDYRRMTMHNLVAELPGTSKPEEIIVLGAHYDTVIGTPGADDNATGIAALLELARLLKETNPERTIRFVAFANEEDNGDGPLVMGSYHYAKQCSLKADEIVGMISLEMLGCFSDQQGSQKYPYPFNLYYPRKGSFIAFVGNEASRDFVHDVIGTFRETTKFPSEGVAAPQQFRDIARSDHSSFWYFEYPALMVTDTSNFRYEHVHTKGDTPDKVDFDKMTRVVYGMFKVVSKLASS